ncbi:MAG: DUF1501 domain-containing protein [Planctomycetota bacterium]
MRTAPTRRAVLRTGLAGAAACLLGDHAAVRAWAGGPRVTAGKARSVVQIWMWGGPSHLDTFDPKPEAGSAYAGPLTRPVETNVPGMRISELLPLLAKQGDKYALIRSMTHGNFGHETAAYMVQTGRKPGERIVYPTVGAVVAHFRGETADDAARLPPYVVLTEPQGRFDEAGFLGTRYRPFATGGDPSQPRFLVEGIVAAGITEAQQRERRALLDRLDVLRRAVPSNPAVRALARSEEQAYELILGAGARTFDLSTEPDALRDRYGRTKFGQSCLVARRLVEQGVPYVTINYAGWDTHKDNFPEMRRKLPELDRGLATLLEDLADRGLLASTIVWCGGEFGRTPKVDTEAPWNGGRGHWGKVFSTLVAGGGFKGGRVVGASDAKGEEVRTRPVYPRDLIASMYRLLGIEPDARLPHPEGAETFALPTAADDVPSGGILKELL